MVVVQIQVLAFPIDKKKVSQYISGIYTGFLWNEISLVNVTHRRAVLNLGFRDDYVSFKKKVNQVQLIFMLKQYSLGQHLLPFTLDVSQLVYTVFYQRHPDI